MKTLVRLSPTLFAVLMSCGGTVTEPGPTALRLRVRFDPAWAIDQLLVQGGEREATVPESPGAPLPSGDEVVLLLPDSSAGKPLNLAVLGLAGSHPAGHRSLTATPKLHATVDVDVTLAASACDASCEVGSRDCLDGVRTCELDLAAGCGAWSEAQACPSDEPFCSNGVCGKTCSDECVEGTTECDGSAKERHCARGKGPDACLSWQEPVLCGKDESCKGDSCTSIYGGSWTPMTTDDAPSIYYTVATWAGDRMLVWNPDSFTYGGFSYDPSADEWDETSGLAPAPDLNFPVASWNGSELLVLDTSTGTQAFSYSAGTDSWAPVSTAGAPSPRYNATALWVGNEFIVWGGEDYDLDEPVNTGGVYDPENDAWSSITTDGAPVERTSASLCSTGTAMFVWGGYGATFLELNSGALYSPSTNTWKPIAKSGAPSPRANAACVWTGSEMFVWGGNIGSDELGDGALYDPSTDAWRPVAAEKAPSPRYGHSVVWTGTEVVVWGGSVVNYSCTRTGARYDPSADVWTPMPMEGAPSRRMLPVMLWTGSQVLVWSGIDDGNEEQYTGALFTP